MVDVTREGSMSVYRKLLENPPPGPEVPFKPPRPDYFTLDGRSVVSVVRSNNRVEGVKEAVRLTGGLRPMVRGTQGEILIKPNCNTDDPYPRDTHPETIRTIAEALISEGVSKERIVVGETSGRARGLPTRHTVENLGIKALADELGIGLCFFEEEDWVTVKAPNRIAWPDGIKIPRRVYEAERVILTPIMRPHSTATFTISMKLSVGMLDSVGREWLHNEEAHDAKVAELNTVYSADLVVADATKMITGRDPRLMNVVESGIIVAGSNRVATDAVCVGLMKMHRAARVSEIRVLGHEQFKAAERLGIGSPRIEDIDLRFSDLVGDECFPDFISGIREELGERPG
jgi:uncharacterized protein (DUF362 family)